MNVLAYGFALVAALLLAPNDFGALTALLGIFLVPVDPCQQMPDVDRREVVKFAMLALKPSRCHQ